MLRQLLILPGRFRGWPRLCLFAGGRGRTSTRDQSGRCDALCGALRTTVRGGSHEKQVRTAGSDGDSRAAGHGYRGLRKDHT